jgi:hypothetical protein
MMMVNVFIKVPFGADGLSSVAVDMLSMSAYYHPQILIINFCG